MLSKRELDEMLQGKKRRKLHDDISIIVVDLKKI